MKTCFITAGDINFASSRMRAYWVAEEMENADVITLEDVVSDPDGISGYDVCIWQKTIDINLIKSLPKTLHYWDVCDPSWWFQPEYCRQVLEYTSGVVCSNDALADDFKEWSGLDNVHAIPDRLKLSHFHKRRQHVDTDHIRFIWFGYSMNRIALWGAVANLQRLKANGHKFTLTIMDDRPDAPVNFDFPVRHVKWSLENEVDILAAHDVALLPPYPGAWGRVKSDNKSMASIVCGLPASSGVLYKRLEACVTSHEERQRMVDDYADDIEEIFNVRESAHEWEVLLS